MLQRVCVVEGEELDAIDQVSEGLPEGGLVGERERADRPPVEAALESEDAGLSGLMPVAQHCLEGSLVRLGPGVGEEDAGSK